VGSAGTESTDLAADAIGGRRIRNESTTSPAPLRPAAKAASTASPAPNAAMTDAQGSSARTEENGDEKDRENSAKAEKLRTALWMLKFAVPAKNLFSVYLLGPVVFGDCRTERFCIPWLNTLLLFVDVSAFTVHLLLGVKLQAYREQVLAYNFYILSVSWSLWNLCSHPLYRQYVVDLFVAPPEVHMTINIVAIAVCSSQIMAPPSMRHLIGLVTWEFLISLVLSSVEVMNFSMDSSWLAIVRLDIVMFNIAILLIGTTIILGTMTVEKDIKSLAHEMEQRLGSSGAFEEDLERRKRAVLTALCDAVLTTGPTFVINESDDGADRIFRRPMLNEPLTDYFKDAAEKERFLAAVGKQFPEDDTVGEGPKRMRVTLRDDGDELFDADIVVSDASTDKNGKVKKYMVGMHIRSEFRSRTVAPAAGEDGCQRNRTGFAGDKRHVACGLDGHGVGNAGGFCEKGCWDRRGGAFVGAGVDAKGVTTDPPGGDERNQHHLYEELSHEIFAAFEEVLCLPSQERPKGTSGGEGTKILNETSEKNGRAGLPSLGAAACKPATPFILRRATCEIFRRRAAPLTSRAGERHVDLRRLSLPEPMNGLS